MSTKNHRYVPEALIIDKIRYIDIYRRHPYSYVTVVDVTRARITRRRRTTFTRTPGPDRPQRFSAVERNTIESVRRSCPRLLPSATHRFREYALVPPSLRPIRSLACVPIANSVYVPFPFYPLARGARVSLSLVITRYFIIIIKYITRLDGRRDARSAVT